MDLTKVIGATIPVEEFAKKFDWQASVLDRDLTSPPIDPQEHDRYIVALGATGDWLDHDNEIAVFENFVWNFVTPDLWFTVGVDDEGILCIWNGAAWVRFSTTINHNTLLNTHNLTSHIDHNSITNTHNLTTDIDHNSISNTHNLTTDIDHNQLTNYVSNQHIDWTNASYNLQTSGALNALDLTLNSLSASQIVETNASKKLITVPKGSAYNKNFGVGVGNVAQGNTTVNLSGNQTIAGQKTFSSKIVTDEVDRLSGGGSLILDGIYIRNGMLTYSIGLSATTGTVTTSFLYGYQGADVKFNSPAAVDVIKEKTSGAGVNVDSVLLKDGIVNASNFNLNSESLFGSSSVGGNTQDQYQGGSHDVVYTANSWQSFTPGKSGKLTTVAWWQAGPGGNCSYNVTMNIYAGEGTGGALLASRSFLTPPYPTWSYANFSSPPDVIAGQKYTFQVIGHGCTPGHCRHLSNPYPGGYFYTGTGHDETFKTYVDDSRTITHFYLGQEKTQYNSLEMRFNYISAGNSANYVSLGLNGNSESVTLSGNGNLTITGGSEFKCYSQNLSAFYMNASTGLFFVSASAIGGNHGWSNWSDLRLKKDIFSLENSLEKIARLKGIEFKWNIDGYNDKPRFGFVAQEVLEVVPEVVSVFRNYYAIEYTALIPLLVEAIKELKAEVVALKDQANG